MAEEHVELSFTSFLKKIGQVLALGLEIAGDIFPAIQPLFGSLIRTSPVATAAIDVIGNDFTAIATAIIAVETTLQGASGPAKAAAAIPWISNIVKTSQLVGPHKIVDHTLFAAGIAGLNDDMVKILNSLDSSAIKLK